MALQTAIPIFRNSRLLFTYNSMVQGNTADTVSLQLHQAFQDTLRDTYGANRPYCVQLGVDGQTIANFTAGFSALCGFINPDIVFIDGLPNDFGILQATLDALWTKLIDSTQYKRGAIPRAVIWMSTVWRNDESFGGANQATIQTDNALAATRTAANNATFAAVSGGGTRFCDVWAYWATRTRFQDNPSNVTSGIYTPQGDGTHTNLLGSQLYRDALLGINRASSQIVTTNGQTGVVSLVT